MLAVPATLLKRLRLEQAINDEAQSWQSLMPPTPGLEPGYCERGDTRSLA